MVSIARSRTVAFPISGVDMPKMNKHRFSHYQCLACGSSFHTNELHTCGEPHLDRFDHSTFIGPMCNNCMKAHYITNHEDRPARMVGENELGIMVDMLWIVD